MAYDDFWVIQQALERARQEYESRRPPRDMASNAPPRNRMTLAQRQAYDDLEAANRRSPGAGYFGITNEQANAMQAVINVNNALVSQQEEQQRAQQQRTEQQRAQQQRTEQQRAEQQRAEQQRAQQQQRERFAAERAANQLAEQQRAEQRRQRIETLSESLSKTPEGRAEIALQHEVYNLLNQPFVADLEDSRGIGERRPAATSEQFQACSNLMSVYAKAIEYGGYDELLQASQALKDANANYLLIMAEQERAAREAQEIRQRMEELSESLSKTPEGRAEIALQHEVYEQLSQPFVFDLEPSCNIFELRPTAPTPEQLQAHADLTEVYTNATQYGGYDALLQASQALKDANNNVSLKIAERERIEGEVKEIFRQIDAWKRTPEGIEGWKRSPEGIEALQRYPIVQHRLDHPRTKEEQFDRDYLVWKKTPEGIEALQRIEGMTDREKRFLADNAPTHMNFLNTNRPGSGGQQRRGGFFKAWEADLDDRLELRFDRLKDNLFGWATKNGDQLSSADRETLGSVDPSSFFFQRALNDSLTATLYGLEPATASLELR